MNPEEHSPEFEVRDLGQPHVRPDNTHEAEEIEISPDVLEILKAKIQDINKMGNGVTTPRTYSEERSIRSEWGKQRFMSILENGLLGSSLDLSGLSEEEKDKLRSDNKSAWAYSARKNHRARFYANIIGRDVEDIQHSIWSRHGEVTFVFDLSDYKLTMSMPSDAKARSKTYRRNIHQEFLLKKMEASGIDPAAPLEEVVPKMRDADKKLIGANKDNPDNVRNLLFGETTIRDLEEEFKQSYILRHRQGEDGYVISHRVAPRKFIGIVLNPQRLKTSDEIKRFGTNNILDPGEMTATDDSKVLEEDITTLVKLMAETYKGKEELMLPIYDRAGNLLWPEKMSYEDIRKLEAEKTSDDQMNG